MLPINISACRNHDLQYYVSLLAYLVSGSTVLFFYVFAVWCLTADIGLTSCFPCLAGPFSNWLIWLVLALGSNLAVLNLNTNPMLPRDRRLTPGIARATSSEQPGFVFALWPKVSDGLSKRLQDFAHSPSDLPRSSSSLIGDSATVSAAGFQTLRAPL